MDIIYIGHVQCSDDECTFAFSSLKTAKDDCTCVHSSFKK